MKHTIKKLSALLLALVMVLALATVTTVAGTPVGVKYLDENGVEQTLEGNYLTIMDIEGDVVCPSGWYVVSKDATITGRITVNGNVKLILCDGAKLTASVGITVPGGSSLTIYGQSNGTGKLVATAKLQVDDDNGIGGAGIGGVGTQGGTIGTITINGGDITAEGVSYGAGIGGGWNDGKATITINGGKVTATGGMYGAGVGGGYQGTAAVTISGGTIIATGGRNGAAGIGSGASNTKVEGTVTIKGGNITAQADTNYKNYEAIGRGAFGTKTKNVDVTVATDSGLTIAAGAADPGAEVSVGDFNGAHVYKWVKITAPAPTPVNPTPATSTDATPTDATPTDATPTDATPTDTTKELTVTSPLGAITRVTVDGKDVDSKDYTAQGGTVVLSKDFIRNLAAGAHTIRVYQGSSYSTASYTAGENAATVVAATGITSPVYGNADAVKTTSPKTADPGLALYGVLAISSTLGLAFVGKRKEH